MKFFEGLVFLFKGMLFLDGHLTAGSLGDEPFRPLGNRGASARVFGPTFAKRNPQDDLGVPAGCQ
jgi:hypothetical protein